MSGAGFGPEAGVGEHLCNACHPLAEITLTLADDQAITETMHHHTGLRLRAGKVQSQRKFRVYP
jgi:hypothetical protein